MRSASAGRDFHKSLAFLLYLHPRLRQSAVLIHCCYKSSSSSTFPSTSTLPSQSQLAKEIRWRQQNLEHKQKKRHSRTEPLLSQIDSIAAQRLLISDPQRFSEIKEKSRAVREARQADEKQVDDLLKRGRTESTAPVLPYNIEKNPQLFAAAEEDDSLSTEIALAEEEDVDRGFFISGDNFCDDYSAATTADMPEDDMTEPTREYFGDMTDAVEHIEFQQPGQASVPKANNEKVGESADEGDWQSNYGTTEPAEEELSELVVKDAKCAGCGAQFHCQNPSLPGFAPLELLREIERNSKKIPFYQKTDYVCRRCYLLKEYNFLLNVNVAQVDYVAMMSHLKLVQEALILLLVDMTDLPFSINADLPKIIGPNKPMIVIGNKADLLPPDVRDGYLRHYRDCLRHAVADAGISAKFNILKYLLVSAKTGFGVEDLITNIYQNWIGPRGVLRSDIYVVGATNAGKSTLFNAFIQSDLCKVRAMDLVERVTTSIWPGTTLSMLKFPLMNPTPQKLELRRRRLLSMQAWRKKEDWIRRSLYRKTSDPQHVVLQGIIGSTFKEKEESLQPVSATKLIRQFNGELSPEEELEAVEGKKNAEKMSLNDRVFQKGNWCHDTPGSVNNEQVLDLFTLEELINVVPRSIIVPRIFMLFPEQSLLLGAVARLDLLSSSSTPQDKMPVFVTVFASQNLKVNVMKSRVVDTFLQQNRGQPSLGAPVGDEERLKKFPELKGVDLHVDNEHRWKDCGIADVVLSSLGWALLTSEAHSIQVRAWTPSGRGIFLRQPPLLPYAAEYRAKRIQGTSEYTLRPLAEIESSNEEERIRRSGGHYKNFNRERASGRNSAQPPKVVNFDLA